MWLFQVLGAVGIVFRYYATNIKIKDLLEHRIWHLSRILSYVFFLSMMTNFSHNIFTLIVLGSFPTMVVAFLSFDISFYKSIFRKDWIARLEKNEIGKFSEHHKNNKVRAIIFFERATMHLPIIITSIYFYSTMSVKEFFNATDPTIQPYLHFTTILIAFFFMLLAFLIIDPRWVKIEEDGKRNEWPAGKYILIGLLAESLFIVVYLYIDFEALLGLSLYD